MFWVGHSVFLPIFGCKIHYTGKVATIRLKVETFER
jgi:hypothetical protein